MSVPRQTRRFQRGFLVLGLMAGLLVGMRTSNAIVAWAVAVFRPLSRNEMGGLRITCFVAFAFLGFAAGVVLDHFFNRTRRQ